MPEENKDRDNEKKDRNREITEVEDPKGDEHQDYDEWNREDLLLKAEELDIEGRSKMEKEELIKAIRDH